MQTFTLSLLLVLSALFLSAQASAEKLYNSECANKVYETKYDHLLDDLYYSNQDYILDHGFERSDFCLSVSDDRPTSIVNSQERYGLIHVNINDKLSLRNKEVLSGVIAHEMVHIIKNHGVNFNYTSLMVEDELEISKELEILLIEKRNLLVKLDAEIDDLLLLLPLRIYKKLENRSLFIRWVYPKLENSFLEKSSELSDVEIQEFKEVLSSFNEERYNKLSAEFNILNTKYNKMKDQLIQLYDSRRGQHKFITFEEREADSIALRLYLSLGYSFDNFFPIIDTKDSFLLRLLGKKKCKISDLRDVPLADKDHPTMCYRRLLALTNYENLSI